MMIYTPDNWKNWFNHYHSIRSDERKLLKAERIMRKEFAAAEDIDTNIETAVDEVLDIMQDMIAIGSRYADETEVFSEIVIDFLQYTKAMVIEDGPFHDIMKWCDENFEGSYYAYFYGKENNMGVKGMTVKRHLIVAIIDEKDKVLFKLRWG